MWTIRRIPASSAIASRSAIARCCTAATSKTMRLSASAPSCLIGAKIGRGAIVAAGALVPEGMEVPANTLVMGTPAKCGATSRRKSRRASRKNCDNYVKITAIYKEEQALIQAR